jgi:hypothetical protein
MTISQADTARIMASYFAGDSLPTEEKAAAKNELARILTSLLNSEGISAVEHGYASQVPQAAPYMERYSLLHSGTYAHERYAQTCDCCSNVFDNQNQTFRAVYINPNNTGSRRQHWCEGCAVSGTFEDNWNNNLYRVGEFTPVITANGTTVAREAHDLHLWSDGRWYDSPQPDPREVPHYHSQRRDWPTPTVSDYTIGVELETYCQDAGECYMNRPTGMIGERDGSLDGYHGVEFIGPPMTFGQYVGGEMWKPHLAYLRSQGAKSWYASDSHSQYGMHVSVGRQNLDNETALRFVMLLNCNQNLSEKIAGRKENRWASYDMKDHDDATHAVRYQGTDKYSATNIRQERIEVRIFRGTLDWSGFMRNVEYVQSALKFSETAEIAQVTTADAYLKWVDENEATYPNLHTHLVRKGFIQRAGEVPNHMAAEEMTQAA